MYMYDLLLSKIYLNNSFWLIYSIPKAYLKNKNKDENNLPGIDLNNEKMIFLAMANVSH